MVGMTVSCVVVMNRVGVAVGSKVSRWRITSVSVGVTTDDASGGIVAIVIWPDEIGEGRTGGMEDVVRLWGAGSVPQLVIIAHIKRINST